MFIKLFDTGLLDSNTYVVWGDSKNALIIDAGVNVNTILDFVNEQGLKVKHIVLTHGHYDHVDYIGDYINAFSEATPYCHKKELKILLDSEANVSRLFTRGDKRIYDYNYSFLEEGDILKIDDSLSFKILNLPGHTPGSICLLNENEKSLFTGDVIFSCGYGRTDFLYGSREDLNSSLLRIYNLDKSITIYPGHYESIQLYKIFKY
jgi:glyoxylase-like metal-dependent hydrolase (beta-lactamase superfamily II)